MTKKHEREAKDVSNHQENSYGEKSRGEKKGDDDLGTALRSAYDQTVQEDIPPELLDLLGKLK